MGDTVASSRQLSGRAGIALLTLQLRAAQQEADAAEAALAEGPAVDIDGSLAQLQARLGPLVAQRREQLAAALDAERAAASDAVAEAQRTAAAIIADAHAEVQRRAVEVEAVEPPETIEVEAHEAPETVEVEAPPPVAALVMWPAPMVDDEVAEDVEVAERGEVTVDDVLATPEPEPVVTTFAEFARPAPAVGPWPAPLPPPSGPAMVTLDAEAFARMLGTVIAAVLDERATRALPAQTYPTQGYPMAVPMVIQTPPNPPKQGFWSSAKHVDVLLMLTAMVIVLVVLAAWLA